MVLKALPATFASIDNDDAAVDDEDESNFTFYNETYLLCFIFQMVLPW